MALVTVTGYVQNHSNVVLSGRGARLWFRPQKPIIGDLGLQTASQWSRAKLNDTTGRFTVELDNSPGVFYTPHLEYRMDPDDPESKNFDEWNLKIFPGPTGGDIRDLSPSDLTIWTVLVSVDDPPAGYIGWWLHSGPGDPDDEEVSGSGQLRRVEGWT